MHHPIGNLSIRVLQRRVGNVGKTAFCTVSSNGRQFQIIRGATMARHFQAQPDISNFSLSSVVPDNGMHGVLARFRSCHACSMTELLEARNLSEDRRGRYRERFQRCSRTGACRKILTAQAIHGVRHLGRENAWHRILLQRPHKLVLVYPFSG